MALRPRLTRAACRIVCEALLEYKPKLNQEGQIIAQEAIDVLTAELNHSALNRAKQVPDEGGETK